MTLELLKNIFTYSTLEKKVLNETGDTPLIQKHSTQRRFRVTLDESLGGSQVIETALRVLQIPHPNGHKLPPLPLVFLIHGLGGQLNQFQHILDHLSHFCEVVAVDLPGHGQSAYVSEWSVYQPSNLVCILDAVLTSFVQEPGREVVLVGHSMGCLLAARLAQKLGIRCVGVVAIAPPCEPADPVVAAAARRWQSLAGWIPAPLFDVFRAADRRGGLESASVRRMLAPQSFGSDVLTTMQLRWNLQVNTRAWLRTAYSLTMPTPAEWHALDVPVYMIGADQDRVTPSTNIDRIRAWLGPKSADLEHTIIHDAGHSCIVEKPFLVCGLISEFLSHSVDVKLSLGWQLAFLAAKKDKWSLKNEAKWRSVAPVSEVLEGTFFRAMKTLRQDDDVHSPVLLEQKYKDITDVVDISRETPPYDPSTFEHIVYHKFPTVSKLPPTKAEVALFIELIDSIQESHTKNNNNQFIVAVHCHYGFNRTGFFLCCFMIEKLGISIPDALERFREVRPPGIKHSHFVDELYVRYEL